MTIWNSYPMIICRKIRSTISGDDDVNNNNRQAITRTACMRHVIFWETAAGFSQSASAPDTPPIDGRQRHRTRGNRHEFTFTLCLFSPIYCYCFERSDIHALTFDFLVSKNRNNVSLMTGERISVACKCHWSIIFASLLWGWVWRHRRLRSFHQSFPESCINFHKQVRK